MCQAHDEVRKNYQSLHAGIPILLRSGLSQGRTRQTAILLQPLGCLNELERIRRSNKDLAQQWIGIQGDGRCQAIELLGRKQLRLILPLILRRRPVLREHDHLAGKEQ